MLVNIEHFIETVQLRYPEHTRVKEKEESHGTLSLITGFISFCNLITDENYILFLLGAISINTSYFHNLVLHEKYYQQIQCSLQCDTS